MPPDADKLRQRRSRLYDEDQANGADATTSAAGPHRLCSLKDLKGTEVAIDGVIYDIASFDHPGGDTFLVFGGNDVTIQYRMIHPSHTSSKHLAKLKRVGKVVDYETEYKFDTPFERDVKKEVLKIVRRGNEFGTPGYFLRALFYVSLFFTLQYRWVVTGSSFTLAILYGIAQAFIGLNVQHDANHGAVSKKPWVNELLGFGTDFIGGNKWIWMEQHWTHHAYTNHRDKDPDSASAEPMLIFNDYPLGHPARTWLHQFQAFFYIPVLAGYWLSSVFNAQILDLKQRGAQSAGIRMDNDFIARRRKYAILLRALYILTNILAPFVHHGGFAWLPLAHIMVMGVAGSLMLAVPFTLSHCFEGCDRDPTVDARDKKESVCWFKSQVETSSTYGGFVSGCITGGLNFQVEHHLFPRMSSAWYPYIAPAVREVCKKHGVKYAYYPWIWQNIVSTLKYTHAAGTGSNWVTDPLSGKS